MTQTAEILARGGLELPAARADREALSALPGVAAVKGAGAMLADTVIVLLADSADSARNADGALDASGGVPHLRAKAAYAHRASPGFATFASKVAPTGLNDPSAYALSTNPTPELRAAVIAAAQARGLRLVADGLRYEPGISGEGALQ